MVRKVVRINVTYLETLDFPTEMSDIEIDRAVVEWEKENHPDCDDIDWDIQEEE